MANKFNAIFIALLLVASIAFGFRYFFSDAAQQHSAHQASAQSAAAIFAATFPDEHGKPQALKNYAGKIVVLNFWATWCEPCREEMPELSALHEAYKNKNVVVLGLAIDDVATIDEFLKETKVSYPLFAAEMDGMQIANNLGDDKGVLPYTVIINADGSVVQTYFGRVTKPLLEETLITLLEK